MSYRFGSLLGHLPIKTITRVCNWLDKHPHPCDCPKCFDQLVVKDVDYDSHDNIGMAWICLKCKWESRPEPTFTLLEQQSHTTHSGTFQTLWTWNNLFNRPKKRKKNRSMALVGMTAYLVGRDRKMTGRKKIEGWL